VKNICFTIAVKPGMSNPVIKLWRVYLNGKNKIMKKAKFSHLIDRLLI
jgi:hypothetical protein